MKKFNLRKLSDIPYTPEQLAEAISANPKTIYTMIKEEGLPTIESGKNPYLLHGNVVKKFLKKRNDKNKNPLKHPNEFRCVKCQKNRMANSSTIEVIENVKFGICISCGYRMRKYH